MPSEDYAAGVTLNVPAKDIEKLSADMVGDSQLRHDVEVLAKAWRTAAVAQVGESRYRQLSDALGGDLAMAYVNHRLMMRMVDYEVEKSPFKGSVDYILDEARRSSLLSLASAPTTDLQQHIVTHVERSPHTLGAMQTGLAPPEFGFIGYVVMDERRGMKALKRCGRHLRHMGIATDKLAGDQADEGAEPFPPVAHIDAERSEQVGLEPLMRGLPVGGQKQVIEPSHMLLQIRLEIHGSPSHAAASRSCHPEG